ncbi:hypothetical protein [Paracoccus jiaweipingae]|uniref:hypothetical protein n=1 Tax=unclassified Paracoccus (in: a-proteobacteria) TaxID=2688777 RepID=UPI0037A6EA7E
MSAPQTPTHAADHAHHGDSKAQSRSENRVAALLLTGVLLLLVAAVAAVWLFGTPMLGVIGLIGTAVVFAIMLAFTAGN